MRALVTVVTLALALACSKAPPAPQVTSGLAPQATSTASPITRAEVGKPAPDFALKDLDGREVRLSSFKGKVVVLEWFNPGCPFVNKAHTKGSLKDAAKRHVKNGVIWLAVNSGAPGKQGYGIEANREAAKKFGMDHPILVDEGGDVGKKYGATNTPHMFVIDDKGVLAYKGAIDNSPDGEGESAANGTEGKLVSYVDEAVAAIASGTGQGPRTAETKAYGCGVKYGK
jgi:peroxiredoxin